MSNRIEAAIRQLMLKRSQQDALLENIIKHALIPPSQQNKITTKFKPGAILEHIIKKTLLTEGLSKIVRTKKEEFELAKKCGADHVFAVVTKRLPESRLSEAVEAACNVSGGDPKSKKEDVGPVGKYATAPDIEYAPNLDDPDQIEFISAYYYLHGNVKQLGERYRVTVLVMNTKNTLLKYMATHQGRNQSDALNTDNLRILVGTATVKSMKSMLNLIEHRIDNRDLKWYRKNEPELPMPPKAWYDFAKNEFPGVTAVATLGYEDDITDDPEDQEETDNVQDDIQKVTDKVLKNGNTFTGTWNNTKGHPVTGKMTYTDGRIYDGTWTYDAATNTYRLSNGTKTASDGQYEKGTFDVNKKLQDGEYYAIGNQFTSSGKTVYRTYQGFKTGGNIDTTKQFKISQFDATTKKENAYYEGTIDANLKFVNGTIWEDSTKTKEAGKFINGEFDGSGVAGSSSTPASTWK